MNEGIAILATTYLMSHWQREKRCSILL